MPDVITATDEYLVLNGYPFATPAARILDLFPLYGAADRSGADLTMRPGVTRPYARAVTATQYILPGKVFGDRDRENTVYGDRREGLQANLEAIHTAVLAIPATVDGTIPAIWHRADGDQWTGDVHVLAFDVVRFSPTVATFRLALSIPAGRLVAP